MPRSKRKPQPKRQPAPKPKPAMTLPPEPKPKASAPVPKDTPAPQNAAAREAHRLIDLSISKAINLPISFELLVKAMAIQLRTIEEHEAMHAAIHKPKEPTLDPKRQ